MPPARVAKTDVLAALHRTRRLGNYQSLQRLEAAQPELTELLLESATGLHDRLLAQKLPLPVARRLVRRVENLGVTIAHAMTLAHTRQWQEYGRLLLPPRL